MKEKLGENKQNQPEAPIKSKRKWTPFLWRIPLLTTIAVGGYYLERALVEKIEPPKIFEIRLSRNVVFLAKSGDIALGDVLIDGRSVPNDDGGTCRITKINQDAAVFAPLGGEVRIAKNMSREELIKESEKYLKESERCKEVTIKNFPEDFTNKPEKIEPDFHELGPGEIN